MTPVARSPRPDAAPAGPPVLRRRNFGRNHAYYLGNEKIPGVTTLIREGMPMPALPRWAARTVAQYVADNLDEIAKLKGRNAIVGMLSEVPWDARDEAAVRGTDVHVLAERLQAQEDVEVPAHLEGYVDAYLAFVDDWNPQAEITEKPVVSRKWKYAGTCDLICSLPRLGKTCLIDYKTGLRGPFPEVALQLSAYRFAESMLDREGVEVPMPQVEWCGVLWLRDDGYSLIPVAAGEEQFRAFLYVAQVAKFAGNSKDLIGSPLEVSR